MNGTLAWGISLAMLTVIACVLAARSQRPPGDIINRPPPMPTDSVPNTDYDPIIVARQRAALAAERQKEMISDTYKLLKLAKQLNYDVAASGTDTLTPDDMHRLAEIEKLARSVKEKMAIEGQTPPIQTSPLSFPSHHQ